MVVVSGGWVRVRVRGRACLAVCVVVVRRLIAKPSAAIAHSPTLKAISRRLCVILPPF